MDELIKFATTPIAVALSFYFTVTGFVLTVFVFFRTHKISKILKYNAIVEKYNHERLHYLAKFSGHSSSIIDDNVKTRQIILMIYRDLTSYQEKFKKVLPYKKRLQNFYFLQYLRKNHLKINFDTVTIHLSKICGYLEKEEDLDNG